MTETEQIWALADKIATRIQRWLETAEGKRFFLKFKRIDMLRLCRLQVWSWRHRVSIEEILSLVLPYLRKTVGTDQKQRYGLGVSVATLTGKTGEVILVEALAKKYPGNEHVDRWRQIEQERQLRAEQMEETDGLAVRAPKLVSIMEADSVEDYLKRYTQRIRMARKQFRDTQADPERKRKAYRGNPWL